MLPAGDCVVSESVCCTTLYDIADHILQGIYLALRECSPPSPCNNGGFVAYVTMGDGDDLVLDALSVAITSVTVTDKSQSGNRLAPMMAVDVRYTVRLMEAGWPMAEEDNGVIYMPDPVEQNAIARHAYAHGERMYRKLAFMASSGDLLPAGMACSSSTLGSLNPMNPSGGSIGFYATVDVRIPWGN